MAGVESPMGSYTADPTVLPLNIEAINLGRQRTARNLSAAVVQFLRSAENPDQIEAATAELVQAVLDREDFGLAEWFFLHDGSREEPFATLLNRFPHAWAAVRAAIS